MSAILYFLHACCVEAIDVHRFGPAWPGTGLCQARPDGGQAGTARRASWAMPKRASCLAFGPGTTCHASFRAGPTRDPLS